MAFDVIPTSKEWKDIVNTQDELSQGRKLNRYVYELEHQVATQTYEIKRLTREIEQLKNQVLSLDVVKEAIRKAENEEFVRCNTDWSGYQGGT